MLKLYGITEENREIELTDIISLIINQEENVPADDLSVNLSYIRELPELYGIVLKENNEILFKGIVDEQQTIVNAKGAYNRIVARSMAALLLDNESIPVSYNQPSTSVIYKYHIETVGLKSYKGNNITLNGIINIPKGATNWQAVEMFSKAAFGSSPRVEADGTVNFNGIKNTAEIRFSNIDGINYNSIKENNKKCGVLSNVRVKIKSENGYDLNVKNERADKNTRRERYLDASVSTVSPDIAELMIDRSNIGAYELEITIPHKLLNILGTSARINDGIIGDRNNLYVSSVYYRLNPDGEMTTVKLKKEN